MGNAAPSVPEQPNTPVDNDNLLISSPMVWMSRPVPVANVVNTPAAQPALAAASANHLNLHLDNSSLNRILPKDTFYATQRLPMQRGG